MKDRWKNRRQMAWLSLLAGLAFPLLVLFTDSTELGELATAFYIFVAAVVGSYMGFATMDDKFQRNYNDSFSSDYQADSPVDYRSGIPREDSRDYTKD